MGPQIRVLTYYEHNRNNKIRYITSVVRQSPYEIKKEQQRLLHKRCMSTLNSFRILILIATNISTSLHRNLVIPISSFTA